MMVASAEINGRKVLLVGINDADLAIMKSKRRICQPLEPHAIEGVDLLLTTEQDVKDQIAGSTEAAR